MHLYLVQALAAEQVRDRQRQAARARRARQARRARRGRAYVSDAAAPVRQLVAAGVK